MHVGYIIVRPRLVVVSMKIVEMKALGSAGRYTKLASFLPMLASVPRNRYIRIGTSIYIPKTGASRAI